MNLQEQVENKVLEYMAAEGRFGRNLRWHWDATPDLAQATWEWSPRPPRVYGTSGLRSLGEYVEIAKDASQVWLGGYDFQGGYLAP